MEVPGGQPAESCAGRLPLLTWSSGEREVCGGVGAVPAKVVGEILSR